MGEKERTTMKRNKLYGTSFYGNEASDYAKQHGYLDYGTLAKAFDCVLANDIINHSEDWDVIQGYNWESGEDFPEIYQYFIIEESGAEILEDWTDEIVIYLLDLDLYLWGVTHWGTSWDYVLTDIKLNCGAEAWK